MYALGLSQDWLRRAEGEADKARSSSLEKDDEGKGFALLCR